MNAPLTRFRAAPASFLLTGSLRGSASLVILLVACGVPGAASPTGTRANAGDGATRPTAASSTGDGATRPTAASSTGDGATKPTTGSSASAGDAPAISASATRANAGAVDATPGIPPTPELPRGTTVLHIGDSFAGALGIDLNVELKAAGVRGILRYETATYIPTWAFGKQIDKYLGQFNPDLVLVTLGANELEIPDPAQRVPTIHRLVARLGGRPCVWVGAPLWKGARPALLDTIREACAPCLYLDSTTLVPELPRARDHIHPSIDARKKWAKAVLDWLRTHRASAGSRPWELVL